jgi:pyruvate kinase
MKRTKIVCTIGPASEEPETLKGMIAAGMDVARLNFSHGSYESHAAVIARLRRLSRELERPIAIMGDLRGPRIRIGEMKPGVELAQGQPYVLTTREITGDEQQAPVSYTGLPGDLSVGDVLLIDDGDIELVVERIAAPDIYCCVRDGGPLVSHKGINLPGISLSLHALTEKDLQDVQFAVEQQLDFLALSFVQSADDVKRLKSVLAGAGADIPIIAKIEKSGALSDLDAIVSEAYGVMVARGDLALEMSMAEVPIAQKTIIDKCRAAAVPVITATQMLESMIEEPHPTRAEATDVANAVFDGTDALMLSAETAVGHHPVQVVSTMAAIAARAEEAWRKEEVRQKEPLLPQHSVDDTIGCLSCLAAKNLEAAAIVTHTTSGSTARRVCRHRPLTPILALTPRPATCNRLCLSWGVRPLLVPEMQGEEIGQLALSKARELRLAGPGDLVVITAGIPLGVPGTTNTLKVQALPD